MKILHTVEAYYPAICGMQEVVKQISEKLVGLGHDITVATCKIIERKEKNINKVKIVEFDLKGNFVYGIKGEIDNYKDFLINSDFDIITNFAAQQCMTDVMLTILDKIKSKKVLVPTGFSGIYMSEFREYFENMKMWMKKYDMNVFLSDNYRDINFALENGIKNRILIPNGASKDEFLKNNYTDIRRKLGISEMDFLILNVSSHTGLKGHNEAIDIFTQAKLEKSTFLIISNGVGGCNKICKKKQNILNDSRNYRINKKKLIINTLSRDEIISAYKSAELFLFPSNIECSPIVLFEAMASKTPFLTTDVGNAKEIIEWSGGGLLLPTEKKAQLDLSYKNIIKRKIKKILQKLNIYNNIDGNIGYNLSQAKIKESAALLEHLYNNPLERKKLSETGYKAWFDRFTWEKIAENYEKMYKKILQ